MTNRNKKASELLWPKLLNRTAKRFKILYICEAENNRKHRKQLPQTQSDDMLQEMMTNHDVISADSGGFWRPRPEKVASQITGKVILKACGWLNN